MVSFCWRYCLVPFLDAQEANIYSEGNKPPWTLPAKAAYLKYDGERAQEFFENPITVPSWFPILSLLVTFPFFYETSIIYFDLSTHPEQPQRALTYIKQATPKSQFEDAFHSCFEIMWKGQLDISKPENLSTALCKVFPEAKVKEIIAEAASPRIKADLAAVTEKVVKEQGAFGCPWFWVRNAEDKEDPFFGSDRFHFMWRFLGLPFEDLKLKSKM